MARIKKHQNASNHQKTNYHRRKPNIPELVYKFLIANEAFDNTDSNFVSKCRCCGQEKRVEEIIDSSQTSGQHVGSEIKQERRKDRNKISKLYNVKQCSVSKDLPISYLQNCVNSEGTRKAKKYMRKALDFGVDSGYLIPSNSMYKILRVSSDLMKSDSRRNKISTCGTALSKHRDVPSRLEKLQVKEQRKRQRRHKRDRKSRSGSRTRYRSKRRKKSRKSRSRKRRRYSSPQNSEEVTEDYYEMDESDPKSNIHTGDIERKPKTVRSNQSDEEQLTKKAERDGSDLSIDEDETDDENEQKRTDIIKS